MLLDRALFDAVADANFRQLWKDRWAVACFAVAFERVGIERPSNYRMKLFARACYQRARPIKETPNGQGRVPEQAEAHADNQ